MFLNILISVGTNDFSLARIIFLMFLLVRYSRTKDGSVFGLVKKIFDLKL